MTSLRDQLARTLHDAACRCSAGYNPADPAEFGDQADAVLALFDVTDEWGLTWPPTGDVDWFDNEMAARASATAPQPPELAALRDLGRLRRRWVLTTKPEPVEAAATGATP